MMGRPGNRQRGVALALLLWMVAALTLLVSGVVSLSRADVQLTALQLNQTRAASVARGVGHLLMRDLLRASETDGEYPGQGVFVRQYDFADHQVAARAIPASGFIALNAAPAGLLRDLLQYLGEMPEGEAEELAERIVAWRQAAGDPPEVGSGHFGALEDLLRVPGMDRRVFDRISPALNVRLSGSAGVDPMAAPAPVLTVLARGDEGLVDFVLDSRQDVRPGEGGDFTGLTFEYLSSGGGSGYSLEIDVTVDDGRVFRQRIWVEESAGDNGLPWRFARVPPITVKPETALGRDL